MNTSEQWTVGHDELIEIIHPEHHERNILVVLDEYSGYTLDWALKHLLRPDKDMLILLHVRQSSSSTSTDEEYKLSSYELLRSKFVKLRNSHIYFRAISATGDPKKVIVTKADEMKADFVVLSPNLHEPSSLKKLFVGSVTDYCLKHCGCSVLLAKEMHGTNANQHKADPAMQQQMHDQKIDPIMQQKMHQQNVDPSMQQNQQQMDPTRQQNQEQYIDPAMQQKQQYMDPDMQQKQQYMDPDMQQKQQYMDPDMQQKQQYMDPAMQQKQQYMDPAMQQRLHQQNVDPAMQLKQQQYKDPTLQKVDPMNVDSGKYHSKQTRVAYEE